MNPTFQGLWEGYFRVLAPVEVARAQLAGGIVSDAIDRQIIGSLGVIATVIVTPTVT
jgi:hypothetical protein